MSEVSSQSGESTERIALEETAIPDVFLAYNGEGLDRADSTQGSCSTPSKMINLPPAFFATANKRDSSNTPLGFHSEPNAFLDPESHTDSEKMKKVLEVLQTEHDRAKKEGKMQFETSTERLVTVVRQAVAAAKAVDHPASEASEGWRDDDIIGSPSNFFNSALKVGTSPNEIYDAIIDKGRPVSNDEELGWLYLHTPLLHLLNPHDLKRVVRSSLRREYNRNEIILRRNVPVSHLYVVLWGRVEVFQALDATNDRHQGNIVIGHRSMDNSNHKNSLHPSPLNRATLGTEIHHNEDSYVHSGSIYPGMIFGIESCVFEENSKFLYLSGSITEKTILSLVPFHVIRPLLSRNPRLAQGMGNVITDSVDVFGAIRQFCRFVFSPTSSQNEYLPLWSIVECYTKINNVIHTKLFSRELDTGAWGYALNRLPENVTSTFCFDLVHALPPFVASRMRQEAQKADTHKNRSKSSDRERTSVTYIHTNDRRRCTWQLGMAGKSLVLLRDGFTDLLDFLTMLCVHIIESNKLRGRVQGMVHPPAIDILDDYLRNKQKEETNGLVISADEEEKRIKSVLAAMSLTEEERAGLYRNWKLDTLVKIYEVMMHREEFNVRVDPSISRKFQTNPFHEWALNLRRCVLEKLGLDKTSPLPSDLFIDVVSSNTHCIKNLLCSFTRKYRNELLEYATRQQKLGKLSDWHTVDDMLYVALQGFLSTERPDLRDEYTRSLEENGITVLHDTAMTGLQVDVIPVHLVNFQSIDATIYASLKQHFNNCNSEEIPDAGSSRLSWDQVCKPFQRSPSSAASAFAREVEACEYSPNEHVRLQHHFIVNMDFAFGAQAEGICRAVFSAFGKRIRSVSIMGKAGGLVGKRGDIQLASHVLLSKSSLILEDNQDELRNCRNQDLTAERLKELAGPKVDVHAGRVLTVTGTMLQNVRLLRYYKRIWGCIGTEMEGSYFARVIEDFYRQGIAMENLVTRFAYYTSDLPLGASKGTANAEGAATLSAPMKPHEGVPPLYAIARGILEKILVS